MVDVHAEEALSFQCGRWLSRDEDDGEICRELPAVRPGRPTPEGMVIDTILDMFFCNMISNIHPLILNFSS